MKSIGLDIGTTTISTVIMDQSHTVQDSRTIENNTILTGAFYERLQDAEKLEELVMSQLEMYCQRDSEIGAIGITGQMHGIVYLDRNGKLLSPLYTWQDGRGNLPYNEADTWAEYLSKLTGYSLATGYGLVTHCYNAAHGLVPDNTAVICTILDYIAMKLVGRTAPIMDPTNAASLGCYQIESCGFDRAALEKLHVDPDILPEIAQEPLLGTSKSGLRVYCAIGDNQASFLGAVGDANNPLLLNVGTGGQISLHSQRRIVLQTMEARPYMDGNYLLVGSLLCGGKSFALLEQFFRETVHMVTGRDESTYPALNQTLASIPPCTDYPLFSTTFQGTRQDPTLRGSITGLSVDNFTPVHFMYGMMYGMAEEMYSLYQDYLRAGGKEAATIIGSGNGLRRNPTLCRIVSEVFHCQLALADNEEEAACGAAKYAMSDEMG